MCFLLLIQRSYGPWWLDESISHRNFIAPLPWGRNEKSQDYIEVTFAQKVHPTDLKVYETYNPGSIVRILAFNSADNRYVWPNYS